jgi:aromatic-L-amino-acid decarboxylase
MSFRPLEPDLGELDAMTRACVAFVRDQIAHLAERPASDVDDAGALRASFREPPPEDGEPLDAILARLEPAIAKSFNTAGPGYLAFIPGGGIYAAALGEFIALATNRYVGVAKAAPALAEIESTTIRWLATLMGYGESSGGVLTSGGSMSNLVAIVTARETLCGEDFSNATLYASVETHHSVHKAARFAGFPARAVRAVATDSRLRLDPSRLERAIQEDRAAGRRPLLVVANAGTTNTGAIDPIADIVSIAKHHGMWTHADAAYGGLFRLVPSCAESLGPLATCESITLDPHKGLFLPYGTGCLLVKDAAALRGAHSAGAAYLNDVASDDDAVNFADLSPELSREFRGLRLWLPLKLYGLGAFRAQLEEKLALAREVHVALSADELLDVLPPPELSVVAFRLRGRDDDANAELLRRVNGRKRVFLSSTTIGDKLTLRVAIVSFRTHEDRVREAVQAIREEARALG